MIFKNGDQGIKFSESMTTVGTQGVENFAALKFKGFVFKHNSMRKSNRG